jgi:hypothetical protein
LNASLDTFPQENPAFDDNDLLFNCFTALQIQATREVFGRQGLPSVELNRLSFGVYRVELVGWAPVATDDRWR